MGKYKIYLVLLQLALSPFMKYVIVFLCSFFSYSQNYWHKETSNNLVSRQPSDTYYFHLDKNLLYQTIEANTQNKASSNTLYFPNEKGELELFILTKTAIFPEEYESSFPSIKTFVGYSATRNEVKIRLSITPLGVNTMLMLPNGETNFLQPINGEESLHIMYANKAHPFAKEKWTCLTETNHDVGLKEAKNILTQKGNSIAKLNGDKIHRTYKIAVSTGHNYTAYWDDGNNSNGSAKEDALAAVASTINRVNEVFGRDFGVHLTLVPNLDLIFENTSPYESSGNVQATLQEQLDTRIGTSNYDVGHLFLSGGIEGNAGCIGCVCRSGRKGSGFSSHSFGPNFLTDYFDIDLVAHEIGHQFGANHTFSHRTEGTGVNSEPGSGTTIMSYAGITGSDDVQSYSDPYFQYHNILQVNSHIKNEATCSSKSVLSNRTPQANAGKNYIIPAGTAYELRGVASDSDGDLLYYSWEQLDNGQVNYNTFNPNKVIGTMNRSLLPSTNSNRSIPKLSRVLSGKLTETDPSLSSDWETVSNVSRLHTWGLTVRDRGLSNSSKGQANSDFMIIQVESSNPFKVKNPTHTLWENGDTQKIEWEVGNTAKPPINTERVSIYLSVDGGNTFPYTLIENTPNDGNEIVTIPYTPESTKARIKIIPVDNIYYSINSTSFTIRNKSFIFSFDEKSKEVCKTETGVTFNVTYNPSNNFTDVLNVTISGPSISGTNVSMSKTTLSGSATSLQINFSSFQNATSGNYSFDLVGTLSSNSVSYSFPFDILVRDPLSRNSTNLISPIDGFSTNSFPIFFEWEENTNANEYIFQLSKQENFSSNVLEKTISGTSLNIYDLVTNTDSNYYWRIIARNKCGEFSFSSKRTFNTSATNCKTYNVLDETNKTINRATSFNEGTTIIPLNISDSLSVQDISVSVNGQFPYIEYYALSLIAPNNEEFLLSSGIGTNGIPMNTTFNGSANAYINTQKVPFNGTYRPMQSFTPIIGQSSFGIWKLKIVDYSNESYYLEALKEYTASLSGFSINLCVRGVPEANFDGDSWVDSRDNCPSIKNEDQQDSDRDGEGNLCDIDDPNNIQIEVLDKSCAGKEEGQLNINTVARLPYTINITDAQGSSIYQGEFTNSFTRNFGIGTYRACLTSSAKSGFEKCVDINITETSSLDVSTSVNNVTKIATVNVEGASEYTLTLTKNKVTTTTVYKNTKTLSFDVSDSEITQLQISTPYSCQENFVTYLYLNDEFQLSPNPTEDTVNIFIKENKRISNIFIHDLRGNLVLEKIVNSDEIRSNYLSLSIGHLPKGIYIINLESDNESKSFKIVKK